MRIKRAIEKASATNTLVSLESIFEGSTLSETEHAKMALKIPSELLACPRPLSGGSKQTSAAPLAAQNRSISEATASLKVLKNEVSKKKRKGATLSLIHI